MQLPKKVILCEVGLRDGLQNEKTHLTTAQKGSVVRQVMEAGCRVVELGSFVSQKAVPQMADTDALFTQYGGAPGMEFRALVANQKGVERAAACGCRKVKLNVSASRAHNLANLNMTPEESVNRFADCCAIAKDHRIAVSGSISMAFGSPWETRIPLDDVLRIAEAYLRVGVKEVSLSDTSGMAVPSLVYEYCLAGEKAFPETVWWFHFHNSRGAAMANILAAMEAGATRFDTSLCGLGGCPFVPGAAGNIATEDVVHMLGGMGVDTGMDVDRTLEAARALRVLVAHDTDSYLLRAGCSKDLIRELPVKQTLPK